MVTSGCIDRDRAAEKAKEEAAAKARADAAKKEMETLPKTFSTPDYYKKNERTKQPAPAPQKDAAKKE